MKKKILILLLCITVFVLKLNSIEARECKYTIDGNDITLNFSQVEGKENFEVSYSVQNSNKYDEVYNFVDGSLITSNDQCLNSITVCHMVVKDMPSGYLGILTNLINEYLKEEYLGIFGSSLDYLTIDDAYANEFNPNNENFWSTNFWTGRGVTCNVAKYSGEKLDKSKKVSYCDKFVQLYSDVANAYREYENCGDVSGDNSNKASVARCKSKAITEVNKYTETLKNTCNNILQNQSLSVEDGCVSSCLQANKSIQVLKENYIGIENLNNDCSVSERLIVWIKNILKWIKYILPVIVIVMGIIDFIKAIGADKDDEMKKAQGAFVKRLIAAALVFIIPLIIEFILDKMGFGYNDCGLF